MNTAQIAMSYVQQGINILIFHISIKHEKEEAARGKYCFIKKFITFNILHLIFTRYPSSHRCTHICWCHYFSNNLNKKRLNKMSRKTPFLLKCFNLDILSIILCFLKKISAETICSISYTLVFCPKPSFLLIAFRFCQVCTQIATGTLKVLWSVLTCTLSRRVDYCYKLA